jgi:hypothetical protein
LNPNTVQIAKIFLQSKRNLQIFNKMPKQFFRQAFKLQFINPKKFESKSFKHLIIYLIIPKFLIGLQNHYFEHHYNYTRLCTCFIF